MDPPSPSATAAAVHPGAEKITPDFAAGPASSSCPIPSAQSWSPESGRQNRKPRAFSQATTVCARGRADARRAGEAGVEAPAFRQVIPVHGDRRAGPGSKQTRPLMDHGGVEAPRSARMPCPFPHHLPRPLPCCQRPRLRSHAGPRGGEVAALPAEFARLPDPRAGRGRRFPLPSLLALSVCAPTPAGHDSLTAAADWCRRATVRVLALCGPT
ncbi:transposase family protein [Streptomyces sp. NPDC058960]|uniref:transposase family protein n=1 Tax=Streptomyces sp. NPDC058960 TaxID=3346679 RepID=UPI0036825DEC